MALGNENVTLDGLKFVYDYTQGQIDELKSATDDYIKRSISMSKTFTEDLVIQGNGTTKASPTNKCTPYIEVKKGDTIKFRLRASTPIAVYQSKNNSTSQVLYTVQRPSGTWLEGEHTFFSQQTDGVDQYPDGTVGYFRACTLASNLNEAYAYLDNSVPDAVSQAIAEVKAEIADVLPAADKTIICWGDSLTNGSGGTEGMPSGTTASTYPGHLRRFVPGFTVLNAGVGGETSWMIASRQGGMQIDVAPFEIPAAAERVQVTLMGQERNISDNGTGAVYAEGALKYNIECSGNALVNPCVIGGIEGTLSRERIASGEADPDTGETAATDTYNYYFTRSTAGEAKTLTVPTPLITKAARDYRSAVAIIWIGQNDKIGSTMHPGAAKRARAMVDFLTSGRYIVMSSPSGDDSSKTALTEEFILEFGSHYINIRDWMCHYGIAYANSLGANITPSEADTNAISSGQVPPCLRQTKPNGDKSGTHGNYWYYAGVAKAVYDRGVALGYWE